MAIIQIKKASRAASHLLISLTGPSGSGKTYSAIQLARGLVGPDAPIGFLDTETGRASLYADVAGGFDVAELSAPFSPDRYVEAIREFEAARYPVLVIDSASHEWEGIGGVLEIADAGGSKGLKKWQRPKLLHKKFVQALLNSRMHIIVCLRAKEKFEQRFENGKENIVNTGWVEIQERNFIYEMTVSAMLSGGGVPELTKCPAFLQSAFKPGEKIGIETGRRLAVALGAQAASEDDFADQALKNRATDAAYEGSAALRGFFDGLTREEKLAVKPHLENLKSIAAEADNAAREEQADESLANPFGE